MVRAAVLSCLCSPVAGHAQTAAGTATTAGTAIVNVADAQWSAQGVSHDARSNADTLIVAERLDVALTAAPIADLPGAVTVLPVAVVDTGSHEEQFAVAATIDGAAGATVRLYMDGDRNGRFDPARDAPLADGHTPLLPEGGAAPLLAVVTPGSDGAVADGRLTVEARATTGYGEPGTVFPNRGAGGGDAVVGQTGAAASVTVALVSAADGGNALVKTQSVAAPDGSSRPVPGAIVTYTLAARFAAASPQAEIADSVPAGTRYVPGSLRLDGAPLSDAVDDDGGEVTGGGVLVRLGDAAASIARTVLFQVQIL